MRTLVSEDGLILIDIAGGIKNPKTRTFANFLQKAGVSELKNLFVIDRNFANRQQLIRCIRNIANISYCYAEQINPYLLITHDKIIAQKDIFPFFEEIFAGEGNV